MRRTRCSAIRVARSTTAPATRSSWRDPAIRRSPACKTTRICSTSGAGGAVRSKSDLYSQSSRGGTLNAQYPLAALAPGAVPPGYLDTIANYWHQSPICGAQPFDPGRVYISSTIGGSTVRSRGLDASGQIVLGRSVIAQPSYAINGSTLVAADPRLLFPGSAYALGAQLPFRPLHRAGLLLDAIQRKAALEWVVNGTWVSANNQAGLSPYVIVATGVTWTAKRGRVSLFANNLFNSDTGLFARTEFAQALALRGGGTYLPIPTLLQPRTYTLLYSVRVERPPAPPAPPKPAPAR